MAGNNDEFQLLMQQAIAGDKESYRLLLEKTSRSIRPYLMRHMSSIDDVEDVLQEILISIHKARHTYDGKRPYMPWVYAITKYRLSDYFRVYYADFLKYSLPIEDAENNPDIDVTESGFSYESIKEEIEKLPGKQPMILHLLHSEGYTAKEVAEKMNMTESAVKVAAHRAYKVLKATLADEIL